MAITIPASDLVGTAKQAFLNTKITLQAQHVTNGNAVHAAAVQEEINKLWIDLVDYCMTSGKVAAKTIMTQTGAGSITYGS